MKEKRSILFLLQNFGEIFITIYWDNSHWAKLANQHTPGIWIAFAEGHPISTYHVYTPKKKNSLTKDIMEWGWKTYDGS